MQIALLADAGDEVVDLIRFCDSEFLDTTLMAAEVESYAKRVTYLFGSVGGALKIEGTYSSHALRMLQEGLTVFAKGKPEHIGG